ncbi:MAG: HAMP domain-containing histidine kinase [Desulfobacterales bacterium]|nr:MAG: HAMP domain-containing histidine kinase [Desulfobacterales bacterium]
MMTTKRLKWMIVLFGLALSIPLTYFVWRTTHGIEQEEVATLRYFADTIFDEMERSLTAIVVREEGRPVDQYRFRIFPPGLSGESGETIPSPLSDLPQETYILGYFQNNPDGSFQTPLVEDARNAPAERQALITQLEAANRLFNQKRTRVTDQITPQPPLVPVAMKEKPQAGFADKYLDLSRSQRRKAYLGQQEKRVEQITLGQASNLAKQDQAETLWESQPALSATERKDRRQPIQEGVAAAPTTGRMRTSRIPSPAVSADIGQPSPVEAESNFQVEVAPLQAVFIQDDQIFIFRRIMIDHRIYRQGFIVWIKAFLEHLAETYFVAQPMARYTKLRLQAWDQGRQAGVVQAGVDSRDPAFRLDRRFPSPFTFLSATLTCDDVPRSAGRRTLNIMIAVLAVVVPLGLFALYQSVRALVDLSERRSQFVSSVTHELKTPLTNIRMYIEMLEQGIAPDPERESEYFRILDSESARLSRLINNVLELAKLEKRQRPLDLQTGTFDDVLQEVQTVMGEKLRQEGFALRVDHGEIRPFPYDREVMVQVLINLIENSMKFGRTAAVREITIRTRRVDSRVKIEVSDTGPGIVQHAIKKIFDDFYRVESPLTQTTRGTGIGLALVKKFITLTGGTVSAANNQGPGCTITISLPG